MDKEYTVFLKHIVESITQIEEYTRDISEEAFLTSLEKQDAVLRRLEILGEAVRNLPEEFRAPHSDVPWNKVMATRNILIHNYFGVDFKLVWATVKESLPPFKKQIEELLKT